MSFNQYYISFKSAEKVLADPLSCLKRMTIKDHLRIPPRYLTSENKIDVIAAIKDIYSNTLFFYSKKYLGIPLSYGNIKCSNRYGTILDDNPNMHLDIEIDFIVFQPKSGMECKGIVNKISGGHIGVLIHNCFNAALQSDYSKTVKMSDEVKFVITGVQAYKRLFNIRGELSNKDFIIRNLKNRGINKMEVNKVNEGIITTRIRDTAKEAMKYFNYLSRNRPIKSVEFDSYNKVNDKEISETNINSKEIHKITTDLTVNNKININIGNEALGQILPIKSKKSNKIKNITPPVQSDNLECNELTCNNITNLNSFDKSKKHKKKDSNSQLNFNNLVSSINTSASVINELINPKQTKMSKRNKSTISVEQTNDHIKKNLHNITNSEKANDFLNNNLTNNYPIDKDYNAQGDNSLINNNINDMQSSATLLYNENYLIKSEKSKKKSRKINDSLLIPSSSESYTNETALGEKDINQDDLHFLKIEIVPENLNNTIEIKNNNFLTAAHVKKHRRQSLVIQDSSLTNGRTRLNSTSSSRDDSSVYITQHKPPRKKKHDQVNNYIPFKKEKFTSPPPLDNSEIITPIKTDKIEFISDAEKSSERKRRKTDLITNVMSNDFYKTADNVFNPKEMNNDLAGSFNNKWTINPYTISNSTPNSDNINKISSDKYLDNLSTNKINLVGDRSIDNTFLRPYEVQPISAITFKKMKKSSSAPFAKGEVNNYHNKDNCWTDFNGKTSMDNRTSVNVPIGLSDIDSKNLVEIIDFGMHGSGTDVRKKKRKREHSPTVSISDQSVNFDSLKDLNDLHSENKKKHKHKT